MQNEKITIEIHRDETGKIKVNVLTDGMKIADVVTALDKAHGDVMIAFEMACKSEGINNHYDRKAKLQKLTFKTSRTF
jgi:hypothetical protein